VQIKATSLVMSVLVLAACAATTPAPRFSAVSPADEDGPEAATPPPAPALAGEPEVQAPLPSADTPNPAVGHEGHSLPAPPPTTGAHDGHSAAGPTASRPEDQPYSCPLHPEVKQASPGSCPKCGTQLVKRREAREQP
jgi:hypothetical protein